MIGFYSCGLLRSLRFYQLASVMQEWMHEQVFWCEQVVVSSCKRKKSRFMQQDLEQSGKLRKYEITSYTALATWGTIL